MKQVSDEFLSAVLQLVEYLEDADEQEHFEDMVKCGEDTTGHVYIQMEAVREALSALGFEKSPHRRQWELAQIAEMEAFLAQQSHQA